MREYLGGRSINILNLSKLGLLLVCAINAHKLFIFPQLSENKKIYDYDFIYFYEPAAKNFFNTYISPDSSMVTLSAQVTPIFPLFLNFINSRELSSLFCLILSFAIIFLVYLIAKKLSSKNIAIWTSLLLSIEPSFYALTYNLSPEVLFAFTLVLGFYFAICQPFSNININYFLQSLLMGLSVLIRPIALPAILALSIFWLYHYFKKFTPIYLSHIIMLLVPATLWSFRNFQVHGFFNLSLISSNNIFLYEGVPAFAEDNGLTFEQAKEIELTRKSQEIGDLPSIIKQYQYNNKRGLELVSQHPIGWLESHIKGLGKVLFGVYKSKFYIIIEELYKIESRVFLMVLLLILGIVVAIIWILFILGTKQITRNEPLNGVAIVIVIFLLIIPATGQVAYARFRSPVTPLICVVAALGIKSFIAYWNLYVKKFGKNR